MENSSRKLPQFRSALSVCHFDSCMTDFQHYTNKGTVASITRGTPSFAMHQSSQFFCGLIVLAKQWKLPQT
jgi:hypothetical protein